MYDGHFLNLPVLEDDEIVGMVDVLRLTYATLEQIHSIQGNDGEGPMWSRFWDSFGADAGESESQSSDPLSSLHHPGGHHAPSALNAISPEPSASFSQLQGFPEITPNESASMVANNEDSLSAHSSSQYMSRQHSSRGMTGDGTFAFKFTSACGKTHRFTSPINNYNQLLETIRRKVIGEHIPSDADNGNEDWLTVSYLDDENDEVLITSDADLQDSVQLARKLGQDRVKLFVHDSSRPEASRATTAVTTSPVMGLASQPDTPVRVDSPVQMFPNGSTTAASTMSPVPDEPAVKYAPHLENGHMERSHSSSGHRRSKRRSKRTSRRYDSDGSDLGHYSNDGAATGFPQELMLPAAIAFLGVVILGVFAYSRVSPKHR